MMAESLGNIRGQMILDVKQALASYTAARSAHLQTVTALSTGAGALASSGAIVAGAGIAMGAGILTAVAAAAEFEKTLDYFTAVSGSTQAEYDAIREKALQLGADTTYSAGQIAESFVELGKSGVSASDIVNGIGEAVANLGAAADLPLDTAANIITSAVAMFGLGSDQAVGVADKLAGAANASIVDVSDLGVSIKYAGGVAASMGVSFEDLNTAIAVLGENGIKGSTAGTTLRTALLALSGETPKAREAMRELGLITEDGTNKFYDASGSLKPLAEVFGILDEATAGLNDQQKTMALRSIFAKTSLSGVLSLTKEGSAGFNEMAAAIDKTTALEVASKRLDNLSGDIEILRGNIDTMMISAGSGFQDFARGIVQGITQLIQGFIDLPAGMQTTILTVAAVIAVILILIGGFGLLASSVLSIIALAMQMAPVWTLLGAGFRAVTAATWGWTTALLANPIVLIITLVVALIAALIWFFTQTEVGKTAWAEFMRFLGEAWTNIANTAVTVWNAVSTFFSDLWTNIVGFFEVAIAAIVSFLLNFTPQGLIIQHWGTIVAFFSTLWTNITTGISNFVTGAIAWFQSLPERIGTFFNELPARIGYALGFTIGVILKFFIDVYNNVTTFVPMAINAIVTFWMELPGKIQAFLTTIVMNIIQWGTEVYNNASRLISDTINTVVNFWRELPGKVQAFMILMVTQVINKFMELRAQAIAKVTELVTGVVNFFQQLPGRVAAIIEDMKNGIVTRFEAAKAQAIRIATGIKDGVVNGIQGIPGLVSGIFNNVVGAIKDKITQAASAVRDFAAGMWEGFKDGLGIHSPSYIEHAMWAITDVTQTETERLASQVRTLQGLGNGITEIGNHVGDGFGNNLTSQMADLYDSVDAMAKLNGEVQIGASSLSGVGGTGNPQLDALVAEVRKQGAANVTYDITVQNPTAEPASTSLPNVLRQVAYQY